MRKLKPRPITENERSLLVYCTILEAGRPLTVLELLEYGNVSNGALYPLLQARVHAGILIDGELEGTSTYDLTPGGYQRVRPILVEAGTAESVLLEADRRFEGVERPSD